MLPKLFGEEDTEKEKDESVDGDRSMEGSVSSITMDDDLTPLERARRRKSMLIGPRP
ncbi:hypothetical protein BDN70DRAFT_794772 [Pholiota conissans]|uniref:Uncharacterized protein n=1 Tax=Pholiota conissans TaxID=109636 RepID=A0A9P5ZEH0_9AGAR|nr:hypothetical protein BDN70DRAFT_794772 [Pholiota conissans]